MLVSHDPKIIDFVRQTRDYDTILDAHPRFNFQMTDLQAAVGRCQLAKLPEFLTRRENIFQRYRESEVKLLDVATSDCRPIRFRAIMQTAEPVAWQQRFADAGVATIVPVKQSELLASATEVPCAAVLCRETLSLPIYPALADEQVDHIIRQTVR
jgi:perosamine synthetase